MQVRNINNVSFGARFVSNISDEYLESMKDEGVKDVAMEGSSIPYSRLLQHHEYLEKVAPFVGKKSDILELSNRNEQCDFYHLNPFELTLKTSEGKIKTQKTVYWHFTDGANFDKALKEIMTEILDSVFAPYIPQGNIDAVTQKIKKFRQKQ